MKRRAGTVTETLAQRRAALRLPGRAVLVAGAVLVLVVLAAIVALARRDHRDAYVAQFAQRELLARVLEDHATRTVETASIALASVAERLATQPAPDDGTVGPWLAQALVGVPELRSVAVVDGTGRVLASTAPADAGRQVDLGRLGPWPTVGDDRLGGFAPGRSLAALSTGGAAPRAPPGVGFLPLVRQVQTPAGDAVLLVALLNPDAFANYQVQALADERAAAALTSGDGDVLAATPSLGKAPGSRLTGHPVFRQHLPSTEHAAYEGIGVRPAPQVVAFRASRARPLVVLVEYPVAAVEASWRQENRGVAAVAGAAVLFLFAMTVFAWREVRSREAVHRRLDEAQAEVVRREQALSVTLRSLQELVFRTDADGTITFANDRWATIGGVHGGHVVGLTLVGLVVPGQRAAVRALFSRDRGDGVRTAHATLPGEAGRPPRHFDVAVVPLQHEGHITGFAGSAADVTGRVMAQHQLQTQLTVTALMLEVSPLPLWILDLDGRYRSVNQAWEDFTGRTRAEAVGRPAAADMSPEEAALHQRHDRELLAHGGRLRHEARMRHRDGSTRDVVLVKVVVPGDPEAAAGILCVLMDVSEFREAERATRQARDAAEDASRAKTEFIANISHELRTPLQSILGFSELGIDRGAPHPRLAAMFGEIHASGSRMLSLVNDLLDLARLESTVGGFVLAPADLRPLVRTVVDELAPLLARRDLVVAVQLPDGPLVANVDPLRFQQVVRNVMANAIKFSPAGGRIAVRGEGPGGGTDVASATASGHDVHLVVTDQGPGIPPAELDRVFDAFVQSSLTKDGAGGTGLGLAICRRILQAHGGRISARNLPEGGAAFDLWLPAASPPDVPADPPTA